MTIDPDDTLDATLRRAMARRPEPPDATNLAARALAMARDERRARATPAAVPSWVRWLTTAAALVATLAALVAGYVKLAALLAAQAAYSTSATSDATSAGELAPTLVVGGAGLALAIVYVAIAGTSDAAGDA